MECADEWAEAWREDGRDEWADGGPGCVARWTNPFSSSLGMFLRPGISTLCFHVVSIVLCVSEKHGDKGMSEPRFAMLMALWSLRLCAGRRPVVLIVSGVLLRMVPLKRRPWIAPRGVWILRQVCADTSVSIDGRPLPGCTDGVE